MPEGAEALCFCRRKPRYERRTRDRAMTEYSDSPGSEPLEFKIGPRQPSTSASDTIMSRNRAAWARRRDGHYWADWCTLGEALATGRTTAMRDVGTNTPHGTRYRAAIGTWLRCCGFDDIHKTDRRRPLTCWDNLSEIRDWLAALPPEKQQQLNHPRGVLRHWKRSLHAPAPKPKKPGPGLAAAWKAATPEQRAPRSAKLAVSELLSLLSGRGHYSARQARGRPGGSIGVVIELARHHAHWRAAEGVLGPQGH